MWSPVYDKMNKLFILKLGMFMYGYSFKKFFLNK